MAQHNDWADFGEVEVAAESTQLNDFEVPSLGLDNCVDLSQTDAVSYYEEMGRVLAGLHLSKNKTNILENDSIGGPNKIPLKNNREVIIGDPMADELIIKYGEGKKRELDNQVVSLDEVVDEAGTEEATSKMPEKKFNGDGPCMFRTLHCVPPIMETATLKHPEFANESARDRSYDTWPKTMKQKPHDLSDAGFFYTRKGDRVKCFSCGGGLRDWDENDVPWEQHALWFSKCEYLKLIKGQEYIDLTLVKKKLQDESGTSDDDQIRSSETLPQMEKTIANSAESASSSCGDTESGNGYDYGQSEKKSKLCKICYSCEYNVVFIPCGHIAACGKCASSVTKCPMCRKLFNSIMRIYFA